MSYIYLASPYSGKERVRYADALEYTVDRTREGEIIFSPIVHSHQMSSLYELPGDWVFWERIDRAFIDSCTKIRVLMLDGWKESKGVTAELAYATKIGKEVEYVDPLNT